MISPAKKRKVNDMKRNFKIFSNNDNLLGSRNIIKGLYLFFFKFVETQKKLYHLCVHSITTKY